MIEELPLEVPTNATVKGPIITYAPKAIHVRYGFENDDGSVTWGIVEFEEAIACEYHEWVCNTIVHLPYGKIMFSENESDWYVEAMKSWDRQVGGTQYQRDLGGKGRFRNFIIDFDDVGVLQVIASKVTVLPSAHDESSTQG